MSACELFTENAWRPELCATCQRPRGQHGDHRDDGEGGQATGGQGKSRISWRRRSEPNPTSTIAGVRISHLASRFQDHNKPLDKQLSSGDLKSPTSHFDPSHTNNSHNSTTSHSAASTTTKPRLNGSRSAENVLDEPEKSIRSSAAATTTASSSSSTAAATSKPTVGSNSSSLHGSSSTQNNSKGAVSTTSLKDSKAEKESSNAKTGLADSTSQNKSVNHNSSGRKGTQPTDATKPRVSASTSSKQSSSAITNKSDTSQSQNPKSSRKVIPKNNNSNNINNISNVATHVSAINTANKASSDSNQHKKPPPKKNSNGAKDELNSSSKSKSNSSYSVKKLSSNEFPAPTSLQKSNKPGITKEKAKVSVKTKRRVSIPETSPEIIGEDGGLGNLSSEEDNTESGAVDGVGDGSELYLSLTDEEKQFALLALGNTVWNSDTRNLQVDSELSKRICREFEDLRVEALWQGDRFTSLLDCDAIKSSLLQQNGTFPQVSAAKGKSRNSKGSLEDLVFGAKGAGENGSASKKTNMKTVRLAGSEHCSESDEETVRTGAGHRSGKTQSSGLSSGVERLKSSSVTSGTSSLNSLNSDSCGGSEASTKDKYGSSCGSADSGVEMGSGDQPQSGPKDRSISYTMGDITDCLYETLPGEEDDPGSPQQQRNATARQGRKSTSGPGGTSTSVDPRPQVKSRSASSSAERKFSHSLDDLESFRPDLDLSLTESTMEGFQAIALLNDVLKDYGDLNESSTDDPETKKDASGGTGASKSASKKSSDFEARMKSVAAHLDLSKQQQHQPPPQPTTLPRQKKQAAPRPPVSPPPEPTTLQNVVSPKKTLNQPDPVFKMVTVGKPIMALPPQTDIPKSAKNSSGPPPGLEEFAIGAENAEVSCPKSTNGDGKSGGGKKGITSFFKNILRRGGKDTGDSFESMNPDVQLSAKVDRHDSSSSLHTGGAGSNPGSLDDEAAGDGSTSGDRKLSIGGGGKFSPQAKFMVMPPSFTPTGPNSSPPQKRFESDSGLGIGNSDSTPQSPVPSSSATSSATASPTTQRKSRGMASPKMILKKASAKFSPPVSRRKSSEKEKDNHHTSDPTNTTSSSAASGKPFPAPKPSVPPPVKPPSSSSSTSTTSSSGVLSSSTSSVSSAGGKDATATTTAVGSSSVTKDQGGLVRRRAKSPKRTVPPPVPHTRTSVGPGNKPVGGTDGRNVDITRELEWRLSKSVTEHTGSGTLPRPEGRRSMPVPPPSPPTEVKKEKGRGGSPSPPISPIRETDHSLPSSPSSPTVHSFDFNNEWSGGSTSTIEDDHPKMPAEKIELPTVAHGGRKGILGKLSGTRKHRAPQPPSVKRAKSITESSTLPRGDKKNKRINVADISGPVMVTDITNSRALENRRNTISLGDDPAFSSVPSIPASIPPMSDKEKEEFDEFDFPVLSPLGSLENLYESILPKDGSKFHFYDPPSSPKPLCPNIPADGYLEPITPHSLANALSLASSSTTSSSSSSLITTTTTTTTTSSASAEFMTGGLPKSSATAATPAGQQSSLSSSSSSSSASSATTNASVVKSPVRSKSLSAAHSKVMPGASMMGHTGESNSSASSSEAASAENSGGSLPETTHQGGPVLARAHSAPGVGAHFVEPEMTEERRLLLASQPIYEEIPNGNDEDEIFEDSKPVKETGKKNPPAVMEKFSKGKIQKSREEEKRRPSDSAIITGEKLKRKTSSAGSSGSNLQGILLPGMSGTGEMTKAQIAHAWLQQPHVLTPPTGPPPPTTTTTSFSSASSTTLPPTTTAAPVSPSHSIKSSTSSSGMPANLMTASMTSSMLPPPPPPPDTLPAPPPSASRSVSKETVSSESDSQSNSSTLSRPPRPAPRRRPKRPETGGSDQYVSMNRPNAQVALGEDILRDTFCKLTSVTFHALQEIYVQCEQILSADRLELPSAPHLLKWADLDIYGQPLHASGRCVVYNAKFRSNSAPCQVMILHSRPATENCTSSHPSLMRPSAVFADTIPFSFLTPDFIKTSQLLQNSVYDSSQARCFVAVGAFHIVESLDSHLALLRETLSMDPHAYLNIILTGALQLLSAMSHCLDQGFSVTETDYNDVFLVTRSDLRGKVVAFLPHQRSLDVPQGEAMCNFLDRLFADALPPHFYEEEDDIEDDDDEVDKIISSPRKVIHTLRAMIEGRKVECLGQVRTAVEYLLWGPSQSELPSSPVGVAKPILTGPGGGASTEQELYVWLEKERATMVGRLAKNVSGLGAGLSLEEFYTLKFLLKSSAACLAESLRRLAR